MIDDVSAWWMFMGRLHPLVLHVPIGLVVALAAFEAVAAWRRRPVQREVALLLAWLVAGSAVVAAMTGLLLSREGAGGSTLTAHLVLGVALAAAAVAMAVMLTLKGSTVPYRALLLAVVALLLPTGHLGASMTHGASFLTEPFTRRSRDRSQVAVATSQAAAVTSQAAVAPAGESAPAPINVFASRVAPIFDKYCVSCHGASRQKGGLALHTAEGIGKGGDSGALLIAGKPDESEMIRRLRLPVEDDDHMPPSSKAQPSAEEIQTIADWIAAGASFVTTATPAPVAFDDLAREAGPTDTGEEGADEGDVPPPAAEALAALHDRFVHCEAVASGSHRLYVDFAAVARKTGDAEAARLLEPILLNLDTVNLARSDVGDPTATLLGRATRLRRLDLGGTQVTDSGVAALVSLPRLEELVLSRTRLTDAAVEHLLAMRALRQVFVWKSGLSPQAVARLRERRADLCVDAGDTPGAVVVEVEPEIKLSGEAPPPGTVVSATPQAADKTVVQKSTSQTAEKTAAQAGAAGATAKAGAALKPVNVTCPVSGKAVDPDYTVVYKGRVIGFCCPDCITQFWSDPARFERKVTVASSQ